MSHIGKYIYGVIEGNREKIFDLNQITVSDSICSIKSQTSIENGSSTANTIYTISFQDISAVVSDSKMADYGQMPKDILVRQLLRHQEVIEMVFPEHNVIPMRLGTFAGDAQEVREILAKGYRTIKDIFGRIENTIELDIAATFSDFDSIVREVSETAEIKQLKQSLLDKKDGVTVDDQMKIGILIKKYLDKKRKEYADQILSGLGELTCNFKAHDLMDDKMVLNTAFLIDQSKQREFDKKINELNRQFEDRLDFRCVGPLPPYSFFTLEVKKAQFEEVDWARKKLGLTEDFITARDIQKAHRRSALALHPDKNPQASGIEQKFDEMTKAYRILLEYYRASNPTEETDGCYFNEEAFEKNAMLVTTVE